MSRDISRNNSVLLWQYINFEFIAKYIDNLKSKTYKAFLSKPQKFSEYFTGLNSPLVTVLAVKQALLTINLYLNSFEIGYLIFCLHSDVDLDISFFSYYRQAASMQINYKIQDCIDQIKYLVIVSLIDIYKNYLLHINNIYKHKFYYLNNVPYVFNVFYEYALHIDLKHSLNDLNLCALLTKLDVSQSIKVYLLNFFCNTTLDCQLPCENIAVDNCLLEKNQAPLAYKLFDLWLLQLCYEISITLNGFLYFRNSSARNRNSIAINNYWGLIILSTEPALLSIWQKKISNVLLFGNIQAQSSQYLSIEQLSQGVYFSQIFVATNSQSYPFCLIIKPSFYSQFLLVQAISSLLLASKAQPLLVIIIRFNMLMLLWFNRCSQPAKKLITLIDYLIKLKLNLFLGHRKLIPLNCMIRLVNLSKRRNNYNSFITLKACMLVVVSDFIYWKYYIPVKLLFLCKFK